MSGFVDEARLNVRGGDGGAGSVSFRREAHTPRGGPDGGDGGKGGDVWLVADRDTSSLIAFRDHPHRRADSGKHGQGKGKHGPRGSDLVVVVPEGTTAKDPRGELLADLVHAGDRWLAAAGGRGGRGNARFLSNRRRAPSFAEQGEPGEERWLHLEVRLLADVALVGFPNAGKSTLISAVSAAKPKVADYPFTTLEPHLGVVRTDTGDFVMADIPGLIEGASEGRGLGFQFLRHVERARVLVLLLDLTTPDGLGPEEQQQALLRELGQYKPELVERPRLAIGSKADVGDAAWDGVRVSAVTGDGVRPLVGQLSTMVTEARAEAPRSEAFVVHRPVPEGVVVDRDDDGAFRVHGRSAERAVAVSDLTNADALAFVHSRLKRLGIDRALRRAGAHDGDTVRIGDLSFDYEGS